MDEFEKKYWRQQLEVLGIDEAGRGALCGPLVVCGVSFPRGYFHAEINDSKKLEAGKRKSLFKEIIASAREYHIKIVKRETIDALNVYRATQQAMQEIAERFSGFILTDCMPLAACDFASLVKGDSRSISIAAASILAKVIRDHIMQGYHLLYPAYGYDQHKGYATKHHLEMIEKHGIINIYRRSFEPVKTWLKPNLFDEIV